MGIGAEVRQASLRTRAGTLAGRTSPTPIWRRVIVPTTFTLAQLHAVIQAAMGWCDYHLHHFEIGGTFDF
jgi:hypothetical protein